MTRVRRLRGKPLVGAWKPGLSTGDQKDAYHVIMNKIGHTPFTVLAVTEPGTGKTWFAIAYCHVFGLTSAVNNYNRVPELIVSVTSRVLAVVT